MRQIIAKNGTPVKVVENTQSKHHSSTVSLCVGKVSSSEQLANSKDLELKIIDDRLDSIRGNMKKAIIATDPERFGPYMDYANYSHLAGKYSGVNLDADSIAAEEKYFRENPQDVESLQALKDQSQSIRDEILYSGIRGRGKDDIKVGSEATLVYRKETGALWAKMLQNLLELCDKLIDERAKYGEGGIYWTVRYADLQEQEKKRDRILQLIRDLTSEEEVGYLVQLEALPAFKNKGHAKALMDILQWELEKSTKPVRFTFAIVEQRNKEADVMCKILEKQGYEKFYSPEIDGVLRSSPGFYLFVRDSQI